MGLGNILKGHVNELLNLNEDLFNSRMDICNKCPLMEKSIIGKVCSSNIYINDDGNVIDSRNLGSDEKNKIFNKLHLSSKYKHGCGCRLDAKTRDIDSFCPIEKW